MERKEEAVMRHVPFNTVNVARSRRVPDTEGLRRLD